MGLGRTNQTADDPTAVPCGTPDEMRALGYNLNEVRSCAVPKEGEVKGCMYAANCSKLFGRPGTRYGGFGPPSQVPGTPGQGRENVPYYIKFSEGDEKEDATWCYMFMATLYNRMLASRVPDPTTGEVTGDVIRLLGRAGETSIVVDNLVPQEPKLCNKNGNMTMISTTDVVKVEKATRIGSNKRLVASQRANMAAEAEVFDGIDGESASVDMAPVDPAEVVAAAAEEAPIRRRGKPNA